MKNIKEFILENADYSNLSEDELDEEICKNIKSELKKKNIDVYYVDTDEDEDGDYPMLYIATCPLSSNDKINKLVADDSNDLLDIIENTGVEFIRVNTPKGLKYERKPACELVFADTSKE